MVSLFLCSSGSDGRGESRALEERCVSSKSPSGIQDGDERVAGRNGRVFPRQGVFYEFTYFTKRKQEKIEQVATPVISHPSTSGTWAASDSLASLAAVDEEATLGLSNSAFSFETRSIFVKQPWHARD